jgi:predicted transcriptional regulator
MFGRALRLRVLVWVHRQEAPFFQSQAAQAVDYRSVTAVAKELDTLESLGMVRKFGRPNKTGRQNYLRVESPEWQIVEAVERVLDTPRARQDLDAVP